MRSCTLNAGAFGYLKKSLPIYIDFLVAIPKETIVGEFRLGVEVDQGAVRKFNQHFFANVRGVGYLIKKQCQQK